MSVYLVKGTKIWRYNFVRNGIRYSVSGFKTMTDARLAEANARRVLQNPPPKPKPTAMGFLELLNKRLDHVKAYNTDQHYKDSVYHSTRWAKEWSSLSVDQITTELIEAYIRHDSGK